MGWKSTTFVQHCFQLFIQRERKREIERERDAERERKGEIKGETQRERENSVKKLNVYS